MDNIKNEGYLLDNMISTKELIDSNNKFKMSKNSFDILIENINVLQTEFIDIYNDYKYVFFKISEQESGKFKNFYDYLVMDKNILNYLNNRKIIKENVILFNIITSSDINLIFDEAKKVYQISQLMHDKVKKFLKNLFCIDDAFDENGYILQFSANYFNKVKDSINNYIFFPDISDLKNFIKGKNYLDKDYFYNNWISKTNLFQIDYPFEEMGRLASANELGIFAQIFQITSMYLQELKKDIVNLKEGYLNGQINRNGGTYSKVTYSNDNFFFGEGLTDKDLIVPSNTSTWEKTTKNFYKVPQIKSHLKDIKFVFDDVILSLYNPDETNPDKYKDQLKSYMYLKNGVEETLICDRNHSSSKFYFNNSSHSASHSVFGTTNSNNLTLTDFKDKTIEIKYLLEMYPSSYDFKINIFSIHPTDSISRLPTLTVTETYYDLKIKSFDD